VVLLVAERNALRIQGAAGRGVESDATRIAGGAGDDGAAKRALGEIGGGVAAGGSGGAREAPEGGCAAVARALVVGAQRTDVRVVGEERGA
jgi:hypothetical protein